MKIVIFLSLLLSLTNGTAQSAVKTVTLHVDGDCDQCKESIENAADIKGVKLCTWNPKTRVAEITFDESKTSLETIEKAIAAKGYDTEHVKGSDAAYNRLPKCCRYRDTSPKQHGK